MNGHHMVDENGKKLRLIIMPSFQYTHSTIDIFSKNLTIISIMSEHIFDQATAE